jgi:hypothetical protein
MGKITRVDFSKTKPPPFTKFMRDVMLTKKDRKDLIAALNVALTIYVQPEDRKAFAEHVADRLNVPFKDHFVQACIAQDIE